MLFCAWGIPAHCKIFHKQYRVWSHLLDAVLLAPGNQAAEAAKAGNQAAEAAKAGNQAAEAAKAGNQAAKAGD